MVRVQRAADNNHQPFVELRTMKLQAELEGVFNLSNQALDEGPRLWAAAAPDRVLVASMANPNLLEEYLFQVQRELAGIRKVSWKRQDLLCSYQRQNLTWNRN